METTSKFLDLNLQDRFKKALFTGCLTGVLAHLSCVFYFYFTDVSVMFYYDICIVIYFLALSYLVFKDYNLKAIFLFASIEMVIHGLLCSYYVGYQCDFIFFVLALPCVFLLDTTWKKWQMMSYLLFILIIFYLNFFLFKNAVPIYTLSESTIIWTSMVMAMSTAGIIITILFYFSKVVSTNEASLQEVCLTLNNKNDENKAMLKEIHHRVKNNLQVINSLLSMQSRVIEDKSVVAMFKESQKRIMTIAAIHEKLYNADNLKELNAKTHITTLVKELVGSYSVRQKINLKIDVGEVYLSLDSLMPLGLIINEIIMNSLKYAFSEDENNTIALSLIKKNGSYFEMIISDDGSGFRDVDIPKKGLGQKLILIFVKQLNGTIELLKQNGTAYKITFKEIERV